MSDGADCQIAGDRPQRFADLRAVRSLERKHRKARGVEEARAPEIFVARPHPGVDAGCIDSHVDSIEKRFRVVGDAELTLDRVEPPVHETDDQMLDSELGERVHRVEPVRARCKALDTADSDRTRRDWLGRVHCFPSR